MKSCLLLLAVASLSPEGVVAFVAPSHTLSVSFSKRTVSSLTVAKDDEDLPLKPETSFGADAVPGSQRPVNEFLDVTSQPMFGWASLESGNKGLLTRLSIVYSVFFVAV